MKVKQETDMINVQKNMNRYHVWRDPKICQIYQKVMGNEKFCHTKEMPIQVLMAVEL